MTQPDRLADDYLRLLKGALSHTLYAQVDGGVYHRRNVLARVLFAALRHRGIVPVRIGNRAADDRANGRDWPVFAQTMVGTGRLDNLQACIDDVLESDVPGDLIEAGVWRGGASIFMRGILKARGVEDRVVYACDSFEGLPRADPTFPADLNGERWHVHKPLSVGLSEVHANFARYGLLDDQVRFEQGWFKDTLPRLKGKTWALIRFDGDMYQSTMDALTHLYPGLAPGGYAVIDDYAVDACREAVHDYRETHGIREPIEEIDWTGVRWRRALNVDRAASVVRTP